MKTTIAALLFPVCPIDHPLMTSSGNYREYFDAVQKPARLFQTGVHDPVLHVEAVVGHAAWCAARLIGTLHRQQQLDAGAAAAST